VWSQHGARAKPHGKEWQLLMKKAGFEPKPALRTSLPVVRRGSKVSTTRYLHTCPVCQMQQIARRRFRAWRCRACVDAGLAGDLVVHRMAVR
jgi:predicted SprT family Zn-dependent metalloprotease